MPRHWSYVKLHDNLERTQILIRVFSLDDSFSLSGYVCKAGLYANQIGRPLPSQILPQGDPTATFWQVKRGEDTSRSHPSWTVTLYIRPMRRESHSRFHINGMLHLSGSRYSDFGDSSWRRIQEGGPLLSPVRALNLSNGFCTSTVSPHLQWMRFRSDNAQSACNVRWPVRLLSCGDRIAHPPPCWNLRCNRLPDSSSLFCFRTVFSQASVSVLLVHMLCLFLCYFLILVSFLTPVSFCSLLPCLDSIHSNSFSLNTEPLCLLLSLITPLDLEFSSSTIHYWLNCPISKNSHGHSLFTFQVLSITSYEGWFLLESCLTSRNPSFSFSTSNMFGLIINNPVSSCYTTFPVRKTSKLKIIVPPVFQIETFQTFIWAVSANQLRGRRCARKV